MKPAGKILRILLSVALTIYALTVHVLTGWADEPMRLRVLTYNIHHGEGMDGKLDLERISRVITSVQPDLVALQEVEDTTSRTGMVDQTAVLSGLTKMNAVFARNIDFQSGGYGNAVLSRFPIVSSQNVVLPSHERGEQRGALMIGVKLPNQSEALMFVCTHLDSRPKDSERLASAEMIGEIISTDLQRPMILAGDLNATPESKVLDVFRQRWAITNQDARPTIPVDKPTRQIDFVLTRPADRWKVVETRVLDEAIASDHRAVLAILELQ